MNSPRKCSPRCPKFRCGRNALELRGKTAWCRWTSEPCDPRNCSYAMCITRRLLPNGICGESLKRRTTEKGPEDEPLQTIKVRGKVYRKIGERELF